MFVGHMNEWARGCVGGQDRVLLQTPHSSFFWPTQEKITISVPAVELNRVSQILLLGRRRAPLSASVKTRKGGTWPVWRPC